MRKVILATALSIIFFSCEKTISIEIPDDGRKLTVNSVFLADSTLFFKLTKSRHILDGKYAFESVADADITLFENDKLIEKLGGQQGYYYSTARLRIGKKYRIEVSSKDYPDVKAESIIPKITKIKNISIGQGIDEYGNPATVFNLQFQDDPAVDNYYYVELYKRMIYTYIDEDTGEEVTEEYILPEYIQSDDLNTYSNEWGMTSGILLNGELINGRLYTLSFTSFSGGYIYDSQGNNMNDENKVSYFIFLHSVSKAYFLYSKSLSKQQEATDEFFMEPVQVYSNIENGFGIFAGMSTDMDSIKVEPLM